MNDSRMILFFGNENLTGKAYSQTRSSAADATTNTTTTKNDYFDYYDMIITVTDILA
jgi:hypothetical protein